MNLARTVFVAAALAALSPMHAQIGSRIQKQGSIHGVWQNSQFGFQMTLVLNPDGTGSFDGDAIRFAAQGERLSITSDGETTVYQYALQGDSLRLSGGDLDGPVMFARAGGAAGQSAQPPSAGDAPASAPAGSTDVGNPSNPLIGIWSGYGETIEFSPNGQCRYLGQMLRYELAPGQVTLITDQGSAVMAFRVQGNQLTLMANGQEVTYTRGGAGAGMGSAPGAAGGPGRRIAPELVGRWVFINVSSTSTGGVSHDESIVLSADGTYQYHMERSMSVNTSEVYGGTASQDSDQGRWWVEGDRIFYDSPTRGQGSYQLQKINHPKTGDPMIVLDGTAYVTATQRRPW